MLSDYLNGEAVFSKFIEYDERGTPVYSSETTVKCRKQSYTKVFKGKNGELIQANNIYYLTHAAKINDTLDGSVVLSVDDWRGLDNQIIGYKVVV